METQDPEPCGNTVDKSVDIDLTKLDEADSKATHDRALILSHNADGCRSHNEQPKSSSASSSNAQIKKLEKAVWKRLREQHKKDMEQRVEQLVVKLIERLAPFVNAGHGGDINNAETKRLRACILAEAEYLKLSNYGVEVR